MNAPHPHAAPRRRLAIGLLLVVALAAVAFPAAVMLITSAVPTAVAQPAERGDDVNPRADFWRGVREGAPGYTAASGPYTTDVFIQNGGENFRQWRNGPIASIVPWVLGGVLLLIVLFHFIVGPLKPKEPLSGRYLPRWSLAERVLHWYVAVLFVFLAVTGLSLLFGRAVLIPVMGLDAFSLYAEASKYVHNAFGPFFLAGLLVMVVMWFRENFFDRDDIGWLKRLGGMFGGRHPHAGRVNAGEKIWFWLIATLGLIGVGVTGVILDFPIFGQDRATMQTAQLAHAVLACLWIAIAFGHIYLGIWGTPGAMQGMNEGVVSADWMKLHHDREYERLQRAGVAPETSDDEVPARDPSPRTG